MPGLEDVNVDLYARRALPEPYYPIADVTRLARHAPEAALVSTRYAIDPVVEKLDMTLAAARTDILSRVAGLSAQEYAHRDERRVPPADVYGVMHRGFGWYVKVKLDPSPRLHVLSFHPPELPLRTKSGTITR